MSTGRVVCITVTLLTGLGLLSTSLSLYFLTGGNVPFDYGITIDAGSSKTAFYLYDWSALKLNNTGLVRQLSVETLPHGIDDFGPDTKDLIAQLLMALSKVSKKIDYTSKNYKIPIYLGATAGMRILRLSNSQLSDRILREIKSNFDRYTDSENSFRVKNVEIISGEQEGLYAWISVNYLMDYIPDLRNIYKGTVGTLDMGGASAQIAFQASGGDFVKKNKKKENIEEEKSPDIIKTEHESNKHTELFGRLYGVQTYSNLCYGNDDARRRYEMLLILNNPIVPNVDDPCAHKGQLNRLVNNSLAEHVCTRNSDGERYTLLHSHYTFIASPNATLCAQITQKLVNVEEMKKLFYDYGLLQLSHPPPKDMLFFAMSTFYYSAKQLQNRKVIRFESEQQFEKLTRDYCSQDWANVVLYRKQEEHRYLQNFCFSLNYILNYLKYIYRFEGKAFSQIEFRGSLGEHKLGWALGYMLQETNFIPGSGPKPPIIGALWFSILTMFGVALLLFVAGSVAKQQIAKKGEYNAS